MRTNYSRQAYPGDGTAERTSTGMAGVTEIVSGWLQGNNITDVDTSGSSGVPDDSVLQASDSTEDAVDSGNENSEGGEASAEGDSTAVAGKTSPGTGTGTKETITISDDKGRRKVEIDYSNKEQVKKFVQMAYGARKWQAERDAARAEVAPVREQLQEMRSNWDTLESAFQSKGIEGVVDLLEGKQGAYRTHISKAMERQEFLKRASPEELEALQSRELAQSKESEASRLRKELDEFKAKMASEKDVVETRAVESRIHPAFDKYRFADKLGDETDEAMFDQMLWRTAMDRLVPYEEQFGSASAIPQELIDKEFRTVSASLRKRINVQAEKKAGKIIDQKKQEATENVQAKVQSGYKSSSSREEARKLMNQGSGGIQKILQNMGKYGFGGKR